MASSVVSASSENVDDWKLLLNVDDDSYRGFVFITCLAGSGGTGLHPQRRQLYTAGRQLHVRLLGRRKPDPKTVQ